MKLVVYAKEDIETLKKWATEKFSKIENKGLKVKKYESIKESKGILSHQSQNMVRIVPIKEMRKLKIFFMLPLDEEKDYLSSPTKYFGHLLGHEGKGN
jgi:insulysin